MNPDLLNKKVGHTGNPGMEQCYGGVFLHAQTPNNVRHKAPLLCRVRSGK